MSIQLADSVRNELRDFPNMPRDDAADYLFCLLLDYPVANSRVGRNRDDIVLTLLNIYHHEVEPGCGPISFKPYFEAAIDEIIITNDRNRGDIEFTHPATSGVIRLLRGGVPISIEAILILRKWLTWPALRDYETPDGRLDLLVRQLLQRVESSAIA